MITEPIFFRILSPFEDRPAATRLSLSYRPENCSAQSGNHDYEPCGNAPQGEQSERDKSEREVRRRLDRAGPHRVVESGDKKADDSRIDASKRSLEIGVLTAGDQRW